MTDQARRPRVLLGITGSVAAIKAPLLCQLLRQRADVRVVATKASQYFFKHSDLEGVEDEDEWKEWGRGDPVLHIELRRWADCLVVAPLSANTLAKAAAGMCDNLLTCVVRAWDFSRPLLVAPAMNTMMWDSPFTGQHLRTLEALGVLVVPPVSKTLACGDVGLGAMATPDDIVAATMHALRDWEHRQPA